MNQKKDKQQLVVLAILDGWGIGQNSEGNAIALADTPNMDFWQKNFPATTLVAHNGPVGLPEGQMGNSEVGHLNIGAGRTVYQDFTRINLSIKSGDFYQNQVLDQVMAEVKDKETSLHLMGLVSDGGVHSHLEHLFALIAMAKEKGLAKNQVKIHCFMDGRDTPPSSGLEYMQQLAVRLREIDCGQVATVCGRYWAMDRDKRWDRVEKAWLALVAGQGRKEKDPVQAVETAYYQEESDEFISPTIIVDEQGKPVGTIKDGDGVICFNFRADRMRELCHAFNDSPDEFEGFDNSSRPKVNMVTMTEYEADFPFKVAFPANEIKMTIGEVISKNELRQLRIAETEKYAHVTYFFNGGNETPFSGEKRILIDSPRDVATYDQKPEMSAPEVTDSLLGTIKRAGEVGKPLQFVVLNFANCDMVGHTGNLEATMEAVATVDRCLGKIYNFLKQSGDILVVTADHGNAEIMIDPDNSEPYTAHSCNPVPFVIVADNYKGVSLKKNGALKDIAPTILTIMGLSIPAEMEGESLIKGDS